MAVDESATGAPPARTGTIVVVTTPQYRGAAVRVEPPDQPWRYAPVVERRDECGGGCAATVPAVPAGTCWVHLEGAHHENVRSTQVTVPADGVVELDWRP